MGLKRTVTNFLKLKIVPEKSGPGWTLSKPFGSKRKRNSQGFNV